jgi:hypothetical protein
MCLPQGHQRHVRRRHGKETPAEEFAVILIGALY